MKAAIALITSNQTRNLGAIPGSNEAGLAQQIGYRVRDHLRAAGLEVNYLVPPPEELDAGHGQLKIVFAEARRWLEAMLAAGAPRVAAIHIHTNAARNPQDGRSVTGYVRAGGPAEEDVLGGIIASAIAPVLGLPIERWDYSNQGYLFDTQFGNAIPSVLLEVTRHDRLGDLQKLYEKVGEVSEAIARAVTHWVGEEVPPDPVEELRHENEGLRAENKALREAIQKAATILGAQC